ncbi:HNH endonuclease [Eggerthella lenta]
MGLPCGICGKPIDYSLPSGRPMSYELDEIVPVSKGGDPLDPGNVQPAHRICNQRKGDGSRTIRSKASFSLPCPTSRKW